MRRFTLRRSRWFLLGAVVGVVLVGGAAYATIPDSNGVIHGCYQKSDGQGYQKNDKQGATRITTGRATRRTAGS